MAPFNIGVTIVEPTGARTQFAFSSAAIGPKIDAYSTSPTSHTRRIIEESARIPPGDPVKMVKAMIDSLNQDPAPKRLTLGSDSYTAIHNALTERLAVLETQKDLARSADGPASASKQGRIVAFNWFSLLDPRLAAA